MKQLLFSAGMKLSDLIQVNYRLLQVLPRFDLHLGFGDKSVHEICQREKISESFFLLVCNLYTFEAYLPDDDELNKLDVEDIIRYLHRSHQYYMQERIPEIRNNLTQLDPGHDEAYTRILNRFFNDYKREVEIHFDYEELTVFPYIRGLRNGLHTEGYSIGQFEENHSNIEDKLEDLKNILIKYLPEGVPAELLNRTLYNVFTLEEDLNRHTLIEDKVLVPFVMQLEARHA